MSVKFVNPSGFPEHLPEVLQAELRIKDIMRRVYESYGYVPIETPSVEYKRTLSSKGEISKEVYGISRALAEGDESEDDRALRFDLTVPLARYVAQHYNDLPFPFKRWQIQRVWRGDRPQAGRFREFYQADIDVIGNGSLPVHFDAEVVAMVHQVLNEVDFGAFTISVNHRKLLQGILETYGITESTDDEGISGIQHALRAIDKFDKVGKNATIESLAKIGVPDEKASQLIDLLDTQVDIDDINSFINRIDAGSEMVDVGITELKEIAALLKGKSTGNGKIVFNPRIARGLDYYTGSVYETTIDGYEQYGSICSGGRYADLAGKFSNKDLPGVGISIGLSRLMYILEKEGLISEGRKGVTDVVVGLLREEQRLVANQLADQLRVAGLNTQVTPNGNHKLGNQFKYADRIGASHMVLLNEGGENNGTMTLKNLSERTESVITDVNDLIQSILSDLDAS